MRRLPAWRSVNYGTVVVDGGGQVGAVRVAVISVVVRSVATADAAAVIVVDVVVPVGSDVIQRILLIVDGRCVAACWGEAAFRPGILISFRPRMIHFRSRTSRSLGWWWLDQFRMATASHLVATAQVLSSFISQTNVIGRRRRFKSTGWSSRSTAFRQGRTRVSRTEFQRGFDGYRKWKGSLKRNELWSQQIANRLWMRILNYVFGWRAVAIGCGTRWRWVSWRRRQQVGPVGNPLMASISVGQKSAAIFATVLTVAAVAPAIAILMIDDVAAAARVARRFAGIRAVQLLPSSWRIRQCRRGVSRWRGLHLGLH